MTTLKRSSHMPEVPTIDESGVRGFEASTYTGIVLPAAAPGDVVRALRAALLKVLDQPATRDTFTRLGADVIKSTPEEFARRVQHEREKGSGVFMLEQSWCQIAIKTPDPFLRVGGIQEGTV